MRDDVAESLERGEGFMTDGDHSFRRKPSSAYSENEQTKCKHEIRNNQKRRSHSRKSAIWQVPESCGAPDSQRKSQCPGDQGSDYGEQQGVSGAHPQQRGNWTVVGKRVYHLPARSEERRVGKECRSR